MQRKKFKVVYEDGERNKVVRGYIDSAQSDRYLTCIQTGFGTDFYINRKKIIYMRELDGKNE